MAKEEKTKTTKLVFQSKETRHAFEDVLRLMEEIDIKKTAREISDDIWELGVYTKLKDLKK